MNVLYIIVLIFLILLLLLSLPITVTLKYKKKFYYKICYSIFKISPSKNSRKNKRNTKPKSKDNKKSLKYFDELFKSKPLPDAITEACDYLTITVKKFAVALKRSTILRFRFKIVESGSDAAVAAINYGKLCAAVYPTVGFLNSLITFKKKDIQILCDYSGDKFEFDFYIKWRVIPLLCIGPLFSLLFEFIKSKGR